MGQPMPHKVVTRDRVLTLPELAAIYTHCKTRIGEPDRQMILIIMHTGLRRNEVHSLTWPMVTADTITIPKYLAKNRQELVLPNTVADVLSHLPHEVVRRRRRQLSFPTQD